MKVTILPNLKRKKRNTKKHTKKNTHTLSAVLTVIVHFQNSRMVTKVFVFPTTNRKKKKIIKIKTLLEESGIELTPENHYGSTVSTGPLCLRILVSML